MNMESNRYSRGGKSSFLVFSLLLLFGLSALSFGYEFYALSDESTDSLSTNYQHKYDRHLADPDSMAQDINPVTDEVNIFSPIPTAEMDRLEEVKVQVAHNDSILVQEKGLEESSDYVYDHVEAIHNVPSVKAQHDVKEHAGDHFEKIFHTIIFIFLIFLFGYSFELIGIPSLVGEIVCGCIFGPELLDFVPLADELELIGDIGLILLLVEAGVEIDVAQVKQTGTLSILIAVTGTCLPLITGFGLAIAKQNSEGGTIDYVKAIATGACFSPSSLGVAANALSSGKVLNTPVGQIIVAACVVDDILGLVILSTVETLTKQNPSIYEYIHPLLISLVFLIVLGLLGVTIFPRFIQTQILARVEDEHKLKCAYGLLSVFVLVYLYVLDVVKSSYLTGAFLAGLTFSQIQFVHHSFVKQTKHVMKWLLRIFFACTIGFSVPIKDFKNPSVIAWGFIFFSVPVMIKLVLGFYAPKFQTQVKKGPLKRFSRRRRDRLIIGLSMCCRGEFNFIIASSARSLGVLDESVYASVIFACLLSCIVCPKTLIFIIEYFNAKVQDFIQKEKEEMKKSLKEGPEKAQIPDDQAKDEVQAYFMLQLRTPIIWGLQQKFSNLCDLLGLYIIDQRQWHPRGIDAFVITEIYVRDEQTTIPLLEDFASGEHEVKISRRITVIEESLLNMLGSDAEFSKLNVNIWKPHEDSDGKDPESFKINEETEYEGSNLFDNYDDGNIQKVISEAQAEVDKRNQRKRQNSSLIQNIFSVHSSSIALPPIGNILDTEEDNNEVRSSIAPRRRRVRTQSVPSIIGTNMWDEDSTAINENIRQSMVAIQLPSSGFDDDTTYGARLAGLRRRRNRASSDFSPLMNSEFIPKLEDRLEGNVRGSVF